LSGKFIGTRYSGLLLGISIANRPTFSQLQQQQHQ